MTMDEVEGEERQEDLTARKQYRSELVEDDDDYAEHMQGRIQEFKKGGSFKECARKFRVTTPTFAKPRPFKLNSPS